MDFNQLVEIINAKHFIMIYGQKCSGKTASLFAILEQLQQQYQRPIHWINPSFDTLNMISFSPLHITPIRFDSEIETPNDWMTEDSVVVIDQYEYPPTLRKLIIQTVTETTKKVIFIAIKRTIVRYTVVDVLADGIICKKLTSFQLEMLYDLPTLIGIIPHNGLDRTLKFTKDKLSFIDIRDHRIGMMTFKQPEWYVRHEFLQKINPDTILQQVERGIVHWNDIPSECLFQYRDYLRPKLEAMHTDTAQRMLRFIKWHEKQQKRSLGKVLL